MESDGSNFKRRNIQSEGFVFVTLPGTAARPWKNGSNSGVDFVVSYTQILIQCLNSWFSSSFSRPALSRPVAVSASPYMLSSFKNSPDVTVSAVTIYVTKYSGPGAKSCAV